MLPGQSTSRFSLQMEEKFMIVRWAWLCGRNFIGTRNMILARGVAGMFSLPNTFEYYRKLANTSVNVY